MSTNPIVIDFTQNTPNVVQNVSNLIKSVVQQYIVKPTGSSVSGFVFDIIDDETINFESDITDHYVEANYAIQDHIAQRPLRFTLKGFAGELTDFFSKNSLDLLNAIQTLGSVAGLNPPFAAQAAQVYADAAGVVSQVNQYIQQVSNLKNVFTDTNTSSTKQQLGYRYFFKLWQTRQVCVIETPFEIFESMVIERVQVTQRGDTKEVSDFEVTFKQIRVVDIQIVQNNLNNPAGASTQGTNAFKYGLPSGGALSQVFPLTGRSLEASISNNLGQNQGSAITRFGLPISTDLLKNAFPITNPVNRVFTPPPVLEIM